VKIMTVNPTGQESLPLRRDRESLSVAGFFAGVGGLELGLHQAGHRTEFVCEIDEGARVVLKSGFPGVRYRRDIREVSVLPKVDIVAAGFPCQDLSQAGRTAGIRGEKSGVVEYIFRLLQSSRHTPRWLLLENVPFMLQLDRGGAMLYLVEALEALGYTWAYRVVDTRAFGLPHRRKRVIVLASKLANPTRVLFADDAGIQEIPDSGDSPCGFFWTEGSRGLGWAIDSIPTLKGGSGLGIPSPPAIWDPADGTFVTPEIRDAERLQGFPADWTKPAAKASGVKRGHRWKLVGNAVSVPVARWIGDRLADGGDSRELVSRPLPRGVGWPRAAWGRDGEAFVVEASEWPRPLSAQPILRFLRYPTQSLSYRATLGFYNRLRASSLTRSRDRRFMRDLEIHIEKMKKASAA
jgi:DNA (cytosine-5)-methyltransferase 1